MRVIFIGGALTAAAAYWAASGEASSEDSIRRRSSMRFPRTRFFYLGRSCGMGQGGSTAGSWPDARPLKSLSRGRLALFDGAPVRARIAAAARHYAGASRAL